MAGKFDIFTPGRKGINITKSSLHVDREELIRAQNAELVFDGGELAIGSRAGMSRINSSAIGSGATLVSIFDSPVKANSEFTEYLYASMAQAATNNWRRTTDGATWAGVNSPSKAAGEGGPHFGSNTPQAVTLNHKLYFLVCNAPDTNIWHLYEWDGTTERVIAAVPKNQAIAQNTLLVCNMVTDGFSLYLACMDDNVTEPDLPGRVLRINPRVGIWEQMGVSFSIVSTNGCPGPLAIHDGHLYVGTAIGAGSGNTANILRNSISTPDTTFASEHTTGASIMPTCMLAYRGRLYTGTSSLVAGTAAIIIERTENGVYSTVRTAPVTSVFNTWTSMCVFNGVLYVGWTEGTGALAARVDSFDGTTWAVDVNLTAGEVVRQMCVFNSELYVVLGEVTGVSTASHVVKRTSGGVWSVVDNVADGYRGQLAILRA